MDGGTVLIVSDHEEFQEPLMLALRAHGMWTYACQGPVAPEYACTYSRSGACPLPRLVNVVVVDGALASDVVVAGPSVTDLLDFYVGQRVPVVLLRDASRGERRWLELADLVLPRSVGHEVVATSVREVIAAGAGPTAMSEPPR